MVGIEPTLEKSNKILSLACLPVPPHSHEKPTMIIPKSDSVSKHVSTGSTGDWIRTNLIVIPFLCSEFVFSAYSYFGLNYHKPYWRYSLTFFQMLLHANIASPCMKNDSGGNRTLHFSRERAESLTVRPRSHIMF